ncbi:hypothetical protein BKH46_08595 [Helicobacter sp. 12S02634-8]|uniref:hypothetical protein n=1 Tax=Helicobacter sp. 12S02634-8 TaxID=1476199 RepID=UPI000BA7E2C7|nr:hypothetical protein [Helicobacter sp. 12S02634-8]PAF46185.1 hypothetical protein BKH46_08595 [Helicobacter sp. 12S02634-8]
MKKCFISKILFLMLLGFIGISFAAGLNPMQAVKNAMYDLGVNWVFWILAFLILATAIIAIFRGAEWLSVTIVALGLIAALFYLPGQIDKIKEWAQSYTPTNATP